MDTWKDLLAGYDVFASDEPAPGDLVFLREPARIGVVSKIEDGMLYVIEGDRGGAVAEAEYALNSAAIDTYVNVAAMQVLVQGEPDPTATVAPTATAEPTSTPEPTPTPEATDSPSTDGEQNDPANT